MNIAQLPYGDYYFIEEKAPTNRMPYEEKITFTIDSETEAASVTVKNHTRVTMNTGGQGSGQYYCLSAIALAAVLLCVLIYLKKIYIQKNKVL